MEISDFPGMRIDQADYTLLNAVVLREWTAYLLNGEVDMTSIMNVPAHGLGEKNLVEHFFRLWSCQLIECMDEDESPLKPDFERAREQFEHTSAWPPEERALSYRLTASGGAVWESMAAPDWSKFLTGGVTNRPGRRWFLGGGDRSRVELWHKCDRFFPVPVLGTENWETFKPWRATYWKELPAGYELSFRFERPEQLRDTLRSRECAELFATRDG